MNRQTLITAIASVIAFILLVINTIAGTNFSMSEDVITSVATLLSVAVMWFIHRRNNHMDMFMRSIIVNR